MPSTTSRATWRMTCLRCDLRCFAVPESAFFRITCAVRSCAIAYWFRSCRAGRQALVYSTRYFRRAGVWFPRCAAFSISWAKIFSAKGKWICPPWPHERWRNGPAKSRDRRGHRHHANSDNPVNSNRGARPPSQHVIVDVPARSLSPCTKLIMMRFCDSSP